MTHPHPINIALFGNWDKVIQLEVCIKSVCYYNNNVHFYIINSNISQEWFYHLNKLIAPFNSQILDQKVDPATFSSDDYFSVSREAKLLLPYLLPQVDRAMFLDLGTIIQGDLRQIYNSIQEPYKIRVLADDHHQLDTKVMLLNLWQLRRIYSQNDLRTAWNQHSLADDDRKLFIDLYQNNIASFPPKNKCQDISSHRLLQSLDQPWKQSSNKYNIIWWQFFATEWSSIRHHDSLISPEALSKTTLKATDGQKGRMRFILAANYDYQSVFITTLKSLLYYNQGIDIFLINPDIPKTWFNAMNLLIGPQNHLLDIKISWSKLDMGNVRAKLGHVNNMTNALLFLHKIVPVSRAIYLDSDVVVNRNLQPFYNTELGSHPFAAVPEMLNDQIINVGVMLLNLANLRQHKSLTNQMLDYYQSHDVDFASESVITHFFLNQYLKLNYRYDYQVGRELDHPDGYDFNEMDKSLPNIFCIHYVNISKPWNLLTFIRHRELWWAAYDLSWQDIKDHSTLIQAPRFTSPYRIMICTADQNIEHIDELVQAFPNIEFNITAHTQVAWNLRRIVQYQNVHVYPLVNLKIHQRLSDISNLILDIGFGNKDADLVRNNLAKNKFVLTFKSSQNIEFKNSPNYLIFDDDDVQGFIDMMRKLIYYGDPMN